MNGLAARDFLFQLEAISQPVSAFKISHQSETVRRRHSDIREVYGKPTEYS